MNKSHDKGAFMQTLALFLWQAWIMKDNKVHKKRMVIEE